MEYKFTLESGTVITVSAEEAQATISQLKALLAQSPRAFAEVIKVTRNPKLTANRLYNDIYESCGLVFLVTINSQLLITHKVRWVVNQVVAGEAPDFLVADTIRLPEVDWSEEAAT